MRPKSATTAEDADVKRRRRRSSTAIKESVRELSVQLSLFNHRIGARFDLRTRTLAASI